MKPVIGILTAILVICGAPAVGQEEGTAGGAGEPSSETQSVIVFIVDNSASLPPLDPHEKRQVALEKMYSFLEGQSYRLVLFSGRQEIYIDAPSQYRNSGQWTDFYFAFRAVEDLMSSYPEDTEFKLVLVTDGVGDPSPEDWEDQEVPEGADLTQVASERTMALLKRMDWPLYVILVSDTVHSEFAEQMVLSANGRTSGSQLAQGLSEFFDDDGMLFRRFIYRIEPGEGLEKLEPVIRRIAKPSAARIELTLVGGLLLTIALLVGIGVRSFPGINDEEVLEMHDEQPLHVASDRLRRLPSSVPSWSWRGLSLVESARHAAATLTFLSPDEEFSPEGLNLQELDELSRQLIHLSIPDLRRKMEELQQGSKEGTIYALNLDYIANGFDSTQAEKILATPVGERRKANPLEFLRAKAHLLHNDQLFDKLIQPRIRFIAYGRQVDKRELHVGSEVKIGRYTFRVTDLSPGGRKEYRLVLAYYKVPSPLWLKRIVPGSIQSVLRLRRSHQRVVG